MAFTQASVLSLNSVGPFIGSTGSEVGRIERTGRSRVAEGSEKLFLFSTRDPRVVYASATRAIG
jgi:hypothetical protein